MIGAIAGDIIGSPYESYTKMKDYNFKLFSSNSTFTDDSVLSVAVADAIINKKSYTNKIKEYYRMFPNSGYGGRFIQWAKSSNNKPYYSFGNGSAMRVSPVGWAYNSLEEVMIGANCSGICSWFSKYFTKSTA